MKRISLVVGLCLLGTALWWALREEPPTEPETVGPDAELVLDEPVNMRFVDEETGEEDVWVVTKRDALPEDRLPPPLPTPDLEAGDHEPMESARALHAMGLESWKRGEIPEAMAQFEDAIEVDPEDPLPRTQYGRLLILGMSYDKALEHLNRAVELSPDDPQVWLDLSTYYQKTRILDRSWETRRKAEELADGREIVQDPTSGFWLIEGNSIYP